MIPDKPAKAQKGRETRTMARQLGHTLSAFTRYKNTLQYRAECTRCLAEVFVSPNQYDTWERYPGWEIQHQCTGEFHA